jgi:uncharacterized membrane protein
VDETMAFCPKCGASLKMGATWQAGPTTTPPPYRHEKHEKTEKSEKTEKTEKHQEKYEKGGSGYGFLIAGVVIVLLGVLGFISATTSIFHGFTGAVASATVLMIIGVLIVLAGVYYSTRSRRRNPVPT